MNDKGVLQLEFDRVQQSGSKYRISSTTLNISTKIFHSTDKRKQWGEFLLFENLPNQSTKVIWKRKDSPIR